jgi:hypothetical protein
MGELKSLGRDGNKWDLSIQTFDPTHSKLSPNQSETDFVPFEEEFVALAPFTGLIAATKRDKSTFGSTFSIFHPNRKLISSIPWASGSIVALFWAHDREVINVLTHDAKLLQFDIHCKLIRTSNFCQEEIKSAKWILDSKKEQLTLVFISTKLNFYFLPDYNDNNRIIELGKVNGNVAPDEWSVGFDLNKELALFAFFGSSCYSKQLSRHDNVITNHVIQSNKNFNTVQAISHSIDGKYLALTTDVGTHLVFDTATMEVQSHMDTSQKIRTPPFQICFVSTGPRLVVALLWHHLLLIFDQNKSWYADDIHKNEKPSIFQEVDGIRVVGASNHKFISVATVATSEANSLLSASYSLVQSYKYFLTQDDKAEELISALRDPDAPVESQLETAVAQCTMAAAVEFEPNRQKELLSAASFGKILTDRIDFEQFSRTNRILRCLNHLRSRSFIFITYAQFVAMGPFGMIERLLNRNEPKLAWDVAHHLQLVEAHPNIKETIVSSWASSLVRNMKPGNEDATIGRIRNRTAELGVRVNFIEIAQQAIELGPDLAEVAFRLIDCEPRFKPRVELLLRIERTGEKALECALKSHDPDLIYLCLIQIRKLHKNDEVKWREILKKHPTAERQYEIYLRNENRIGLRNYASADDASDYHLGQLRLKQASHSTESAEKVENLSEAVKHFALAAGSSTNATAGYAQRATQNYITFLRKTAELENVPRDVITSSPRDVIRYLLESGAYAKADELRKATKLNEAHFIRMKLVCLAKAAKFDEMEKISKKGSLVGLEFYIKVCVANQRQDEAAKYLDRLKGRPRVRGLLELKLYLEAADCALKNNLDDLVEQCYYVAQQNGDLEAARQIQQLV